VKTLATGASRPLGLPPFPGTGQLHGAGDPWPGGKNRRGLSREVGSPGSGPLMAARAKAASSTQAGHYPDLIQGRGIVHQTPAGNPAIGGLDAHYPCIGGGLAQFPPGIGGEGCHYGPCSYRCCCPAACLVTLFQGLIVVLKGETPVSAPIPNSSRLVFPRIEKPAAMAFSRA
jgi:hypothetical protein